jgi:hypothetical protein
MKGLYYNLKDKDWRSLTIFVWAFLLFSVINLLIYYFNDHLLIKSSRLYSSVSSQEIYEKIAEIKSDRNKKVVFLGGSVLWGSAVSSSSYTIPEFFKKRIGKNIHVYNLAFPSARLADIYLINYLLKNDVDLFVVDINYEFFQNDINDSAKENKSSVLRMRSLLNDNFQSVKDSNPQFVSCLNNAGLIDGLEKPGLERILQKKLQLIPIIKFKDKINNYIFKKHPSLIIQSLFNLISELDKKPIFSSFSNIFKSQEELIDEFNNKLIISSTHNPYKEELISDNQINICIGKEYANYVRSNNIPTVFYLLPLNPAILESFSSSSIYQTNKQIIVRAFDNNIIDLSDILQANYFVDIYHLTKTGNDVFAGLLFDRIKLISKSLK